MSEVWVFWGIGYGFFAALLTSVFLVLTKRFHGTYTLDRNNGVQNVHRFATPRCGGIALAVAYLAVWFCLSGEARQIWGLTGLAGTPALAFGLAEDITKKVSVRRRLIATIASGLLFALITGYAITRIDVRGVDVLLSFSLVSLAFTSFAVGGVANAINIIDGFHGLASGTLIIILGAFAMIGARVGDLTLVSLALPMMAIVTGFFIVNFPHGKLFLGDGGAYFAGIFVAALAVMLPARNPEVSPWISLLVLAYPVSETVVSAMRRLGGKAHGPGQADNAHLHHIVYRIWAPVVARVLDAHDHRNPVTSLVVWTLPLLSLVLATYVNLQSHVAIGYTGLSLVVYLLVYHGLRRRDTSETVG
ncbi:MAG: glycosyltransferase [Paracoccaceae bacterium]